MVTPTLNIDGGQVKAKRKSWRLEQVIGQLGRNELVSLERSLGCQSA